MASRRCVSLWAVVWLNCALSGVLYAQVTPPVPSKTLPEGQAPGESAVKAFVSPASGGSYTIRVEAEESDSDEAEREGRPMAAPAPPGMAPRALVETFGGTARRAAKLSVGTKAVEPTFTDLRALIATLPSKSAMVNHTPPITTAPDSTRVKEEERNVRVVCWLYAASREADNDYHLIVGRAPGQAPLTFMTVELSGLPPATAASFPAIKAARDSFNKFFGSNLPGSGFDFYPTPIPLMVTGSLFFDKTHATGTPPGPATLRPNIPTIWEIHPITSIVFEPNGPPH